MRLVCGYVCVCVGAYECTQCGSRSLYLFVYFVILLLVLWFSPQPHANGWLDMDILEGRERESGHCLSPLSKYYLFYLSQRLTLIWLSSIWPIFLLRLFLLRFFFFIHFLSYRLVFNNFLIIHIKRNHRNNLQNRFIDPNKSPSFSNESKWKIASYFFFFSCCFW